MPFVQTAHALQHHRVLVGKRIDGPVHPDSLLYVGRVRMNGVALDKIGDIIADYPALVVLNQQKMGKEIHVYIFIFKPGAFQNKLSTIFAPLFKHNTTPWV
ncbi:MAG: hypothetical protein IPN33_15130 [Saprospiraceae bacterium]|nr:hypothetical protein [Saprospiraceae bacterium]